MNSPITALLSQIIFLFTAFSLLISTQTALADLEEDLVIEDTTVKDTKGLFIEYFGYEEYVYSQSKKTELGDNMELDLAVRYQFNPDSFGRLRFETDPIKERYGNKTSNFEFLLGHKIDALNFQIDSSLETNEKDSGGVTFGLDLDSELTFIKYQISESFQLTFFPFNFDGEVGYDFNTSDVTRIYYVDGAPPEVDRIQNESEQFASKTIPGFELKYESKEEINTTAYVGLGAATYLFPVDANFDILYSGISNNWERKEDFGYKAGFKLNNDRFRFLVEYVGHSQAKETGALLEQAASIYFITNWLSPIVFESEVTWSKAGSRPYRLNSRGDWFEITDQYHPIYKDYSNTSIQEWVDNQDLAFGVRLGYQMLESTTPYLSYKYQGEKFIYSGRLSAHRLRTNDESASHGGLQRIGLGFHHIIGDFVINPELEYLMAKNEVFGNAADVREDKQTAKLSNTDFSLFLTVLYQLGGNHYFQP